MQLYHNTLHVHEYLHGLLWRVVPLAIIPHRLILISLEICYAKRNFFFINNIRCDRTKFNEQIKHELQEYCRPKHLICNDVIF